MFSDLKDEKLVLQGCSVNQINKMIWVKEEHKTRLCPSLPDSLFFVRLSCFTDTADSVGLQICTTQGVDVDASRSGSPAALEVRCLECIHKGH